MPVKVRVCLEPNEKKNLVFFPSAFFLTDPSPLSKNFPKGYPKDRGRPLNNSRPSHTRAECLVDFQSRELTVDFCLIHTREPFP